MIPRLSYGEKSWVTREPKSVFCRTTLWEFFRLASASVNGYHKVLWETASKTPTQSPTRASSNGSQYCHSKPGVWVRIYAVTIQTRPQGGAFIQELSALPYFSKRSRIFTLTTLRSERIQRVSSCYYWRSNSKAHVRRKNFCLAVN